MPDYYPIISRAVSELAVDTPKARQQLYERARKIIDQELRACEPPLSAQEMLRQQFALESAVRQVEREADKLAEPPVVAPIRSARRPRRRSRVPVLLGIGVLFAVGVLATATARPDTISRLVWLTTHLAR
jgi:hypothetical protein